MKQSLILCPLPLELDAILSRLKERNFTFTSEQAGPLRVYHCSALNIKLSLAGHGKTQFGIQTQFLLKHFSNIEAVYCVGCAGGLDAGVVIFDVVIASKTIEHDYRIGFFVSPLPEFLGNEKLLQKFSKNQNASDGFKVHLGIIASGDEDIMDSKRASEIHLQTAALAVAWEGAGGARACQFNSMPFLEIRGITDVANNSIPINFKTHLKVAMANVCDTLLLALE
jgi:adenosylhomocysteine nucleosidase